MWSYAHLTVAISGRGKACIPARAGNKRQALTSPVLITVHPRAGGEQDSGYRQ